MTILTGSEARGLVESMIDPETQTQMCGMELTLQKIERFISKVASPSTIKNESCPRRRS